MIHDDLLTLAPHDHEWQMVAVDFEETQSVASFQCVGCTRIEFRSR